MRTAINDFLQHIRKTPALVILGTEIILGGFISFFVFHIFWEMSETVLAREKFFFDSSISSVFYDLRNPILTFVMQLVSLMGMDGILIFSVLIPIFFYFKKRKHEALLFTITIGVGLILNTILKLATQRARPTLDPLIIENSYSFPSGHSMGSFIFFITLAYFYYHFTHKKKSSLFVFLISGIIILTVGISRIYLGVHYPSDVLAGYLAGLLWIILVLIIDKSITFLKLFKSKS